MSTFVACSPRVRDFGSSAGAGSGGDGWAGTSGAGGTASGASGNGARAGESDAGDAGAGGEAGAPLAVECSIDADCDDALVCNGRERCVSGKCARGLAACENKDPTNCEVTCTEPATLGAAPKCATRGADEDHDGHRSQFCAQNPGDDCDDTPQTGFTVYLGAPEVCDGMDNDCDGDADLEDGLELGGQDTYLAGVGVPPSFDPSIVYAPEMPGYGVTLLENTDTRVAVLDAAGTLQNMSNGLGGLPAYGQYNASRPALSKIGWNGKNFGVLWDWGCPCKSSSGDVSFVELATTGLPLGEVTTPASQLLQPNAVDLAYPGTWALFWSVQGAGVSGFESVVTPVSADFNAPPRVVASGNKVLIVWADQSGVIRRSLRDRALQAPADANVTTKVGNSSDSEVVATALGTGFALAWKHDPDTSTPDDETLQYEEIAASGSSVCGPVTLPDPIKAGVPSGMAATLNSRVVMVTTPGAGADLVHVLPGCTWGARKNVYPAPPGSYARSAHIAGGKNGAVVVWNENSGIYERALGALLCN